MRVPQNFWDTLVFLCIPVAPLHLVIRYCPPWLSMRVNRELVAELLSFGADIKVLQPQHLRQQIAESVAMMHKLYKG